MIVENGFSYKNDGQLYFIDGEFIKPLSNCRVKKNDEHIKNRIFIDQENSMFLEFTSINISRESEILKFYNKHGCLGIGYKEDLEPGVECFYVKERIEDIKNEIRKMRAIISLKEATENDDYYQISNWLEQLYSFWTSTDCENAEYCLLSNADEHIESMPQLSLSELKIYANYAISYTINKYLESIKPVLSVSYLGKYNGDWEASSRIAAMYFELFLKYSQGSRLRKCQSSTCPNYFEIMGNDLRKKYCSRRCAINQAKRNERKNKSTAILTATTSTSNDNNE